jgi:hypothetical protein
MGLHERLSQLIDTASAPLLESAQQSERKLPLQFPFDTLSASLQFLIEENP